MIRYEVVLPCFVPLKGPTSLARSVPSSAVTVTCLSASERHAVDFPCPVHCPILLSSWGVGLLISFMVILVGGEARVDRSMFN